MNSAVSILLVDDDPEFCQGIQTLLHLEPTMHRVQVLGKVHSATEAIAWITKREPDLILLDLELGEEDGITVLYHLQKNGFHVKVLVLSSHEEERYIFRAMQAGAKGYLLKRHIIHELFPAIVTILKSEIYVPPEVANIFFREFQAKQASYWQAQHQTDFTGREREVLIWLVQGAPNEEIAKHLYVSTATVKAHLTSIFKKLGVTSRTQAIIEALKRGLVEIGDGQI